MAWEKDSYKVPCLPQGESAWATKVEQAENSNLGLDECFLLKCSGVQVQVKRRRPPPFPPGNVTTILRLGWYEDTKADIKARRRGPLWWDTMDLRTCREELHQKAIITLRWWLIHCGIRSLCKCQNLAFFILTMGREKLLSVCKKTTLH